MTEKEEILKKHFGDTNFVASGYELESMDEYAKQMSVGFAEYRDRFQRMEKEGIKIEQDRVGGIFSWLGTSDETIYKYYLEELAHSEIPFKIGEYAETSTIYQSRIPLSGRIYSVDYELKTAKVIIWLPETAKKIHLYRFEELSTIKN